MIENVLSWVSSRTFLVGVVTGAVLAVAGLYGYAQVRVRMGGNGGPESEPYLKPVDASELMRRDVEGTVSSGWKIRPVNPVDDTTFGALSARPTLLTVGATWCEPCTAEISRLQAVRDSLDRDLRVAFVSSEPRDSIRQYIDENGYSLHAYAVKHLPPALTGDLRPRTYLIAPDGSVITGTVGPTEWTADVVRSLLTKSQATIRTDSTSGDRTLHAGVVR